MDEIKRIEQLRRELHEHNHRYYVENQPTISDMEFDALMHELQRLETAHPEMADPNSPTQRVGSDLGGEFRQVAHRYPMLSLSNTYNKQEVAEWYDSVKRGLGGEDFVVSCRHLPRATVAADRGCCISWCPHWQNIPRIYQSDSG